MTRYVARVGLRPPAPRVGLAEEVKARLARFGMAKFERPMNRLGEAVELDLPDDLTKPNDTQLGMLWTRAIRLQGWANSVAALHDLEALEVRRRLKIARARAMLSVGGPREEKAARVETDPEVVTLEEEMLVAEAMKRMTATIASGYDDAKAGVSREISRRQALEENRGRSGAAPGRGVPSRR